MACVGRKIDCSLKSFVSRKGGYTVEEEEKEEGGTWLVPSSFASLKASSLPLLAAVAPYYHW
jgi:hypothetical protein